MKRDPTGIAAQDDRRHRWERALASLSARPRVENAGIVYHCEVEGVRVRVETEPKDTADLHVRVVIPMPLPFGACPAALILNRDHDVRVADEAFDDVVSMRIREPLGWALLTPAVRRELAGLMHVAQLFVSGDALIIPPARAANLAQPVAAIRRLARFANLLAEAMERLDETLLATWRAGPESLREHLRVAAPALSEHPTYGPQVSRALAQLEGRGGDAGGDRDQRLGEPGETG